MQANEAAWYDEYYRLVQKDLSVWYRFSLPYLKRILSPETRLVELGCGQGLLLRYLVREKMVAEENVYAMDQSRTAVDIVKKELPKAHVGTGDIYRLEYPKDHFHVCLLMETIEHLEEPAPALEQIYSVIAPGGRLFVSFPNYFSPPWLPFRWLCEWMNKPEWIVLQPIDKIYTVFSVRRIVEKAGFKLEHAIGSGYGPPYFYRWEKKWMTDSLNALGLWRLCYHPIMVFQKPGAKA